MNRVLLLLLFLSSLLTANAASADVMAADSAYLAKNYKAAAAGYASVSDSIECADIYFNLGNAEFRLKHYPEAVLAYLRALRVDPGHDDARYNLAIVRSRLTDRFVKPSEMFFISWMRDWCNHQSVSHWVGWSIVWLILFFAALAVYMVGGKMWIRKTGFFSSLLMLLCFVTATVFAVMQRMSYTDNKEAVIFAPSVPLFASPSTSSKEVMTIHKGTTVEVIGRDHTGSQSHTPWLQVMLPDGRTCWMQTKEYVPVAKPS